MPASQNIHAGLCFLAVKCHKALSYKSLMFCSMLSSSSQKSRLDFAGQSREQYFSWYIRLLHGAYVCIHLTYRKVRHGDTINTQFDDILKATIGSDMCITFSTTSVTCSTVALIRHFHIGWCGMTTLALIIGKNNDSASFIKKHEHLWPHMVDEWFENYWSINRLID